MNREELRKKLKLRTTPEKEKEETQKKVAAITDKIKDIRFELKLIDDIEERSGYLEEKMNEFEKARERKEKER